MALDPAIHGAQAACLCLFATLPVVHSWIRRRDDLRLPVVAAGLLFFSLGAGLPLLGCNPDVPPLLFTVGMIALNSAMRLHRGLRPMWLVCSLLLVSHFLILWPTEAGAAPREASSHLVWAVLALASAAQLASPDDENPLKRDAVLFVLFGSHALFGLASASAYQLGLIGPSGLPAPVMHFAMLSELVLLVGVLVYHLVVCALSSENIRLKEELEALRRPANPVGQPSARPRVPGSNPPFPLPPREVSPISRELARVE